MASAREFLVHVLPEVSNEQDILEERTDSLTAEIAEHDVESVHRTEITDVPDHAKGLGILAGWITVQVSWHNLSRLVRSIAGWASRNNCDIEIRYGEDVLHVTRATSAQQENLINAWLERQGSL